MGAVFFLLFSGVIVVVFAALVCIALIGISATVLGIGGGIAMAGMKDGETKRLLGRLSVMTALLGIGCIILLKLLSGTGLIVFLLCGGVIFALGMGGMRRSKLLQHRVRRIVGIGAFFCGMLTGIFMALCSVVMLILGAQ